MPLAWSPPSAVFTGLTHPAAVVVTGCGHGQFRRDFRAISAGKSCAITLIIARRTDVRKWPFCSPHRGWPFGPGGGFPADSPPEEPSRARDPTSGRRNSMGIHSIGIHSNGMGAIPWNGYQWNGMYFNALHTNPFHTNG